MANLVEAVRRSMDRDQTTHSLLVQEAFAPALSVLHHRSSISPRTLTTTSSNAVIENGSASTSFNNNNNNRMSEANRLKRAATASAAAAQTALHHELLLYADRFSFTPLHRGMPSSSQEKKPLNATALPCTLLVRVVDPKLPNFPPATLYLPAGYPDAPADLSLDEQLWGGGGGNDDEEEEGEVRGSLFERVRSAYAVRVRLLTQMNILRQLDLLHGCIRQVISKDRRGGGRGGNGNGSGYDSSGSSKRQRLEEVVVVKKKKEVTLEDFFAAA